MLGLSAKISEAEVHWREFLADLHKRGLRGVELLVSDDHEGLKAARRAVYPSVPWNRWAGWKKQVEQSFPTGPQGNYRKTVA